MRSKSRVHDAASLIKQQRVFQRQSSMLLSSQSGTTMDQVLDKRSEKTVELFYILRQSLKILFMVVTTSWLFVMPTHQRESQFLQTNAIKLLRFLATQKLYIKFHE
ncbi:uncharacterized protein LOC107850215 isoform X2 [Capsicum annuum]|uniref:uncharacterized protein LOC107850215 isoform X2 n=1 Tax=Capsicum annuum TaxID=4072 RepID=UPI001FB15FC5|nr:uncharacterized protein LOC107850215 isoform X2 [Capsicum annuum]